MKKILIVLFITTIAFNSFAQLDKVKNLPNYDNKLIHWGFTFGINKLDFLVLKSINFYNAPLEDNLYGITHKWMPGVNLGPIFELKFNKFFDFRTLLTLNFQQRSLIYYFDQGNAALKIDIPSTFIQMPLLVKFHGVRIDNTRPYIIFGGAPTFDISALKRPITNTPKVYLNPLDIYAETGIGIDWFLPYFKLATELKFGRGFNNVLERDNTVYTKYIDKLQSYYFMFSLHFEG